MAQTVYMSGISLIVQYLTNIGVLAQGATLATYVGGSVSTPVTTYSDSTGVNANPNPMTLSQGGRPAAASGAPVAFWVPGGTLVKLVVIDTGGNILVNLDNVPAINDLTNTSSALQALLASPASSNLAGSGPVAGADLVANAVKSYDVFADVRAANAPILASGQTLTIEVQGGSAVNDGLGGEFYWSAVSTSTDDGKTVLKPTSVATAAAGRYLRIIPLSTDLIGVLSANAQVAAQVTPQPALLSVILQPNALYLVRARLNLLGIGATGQGWKVQLQFTGSLGADGAGAGVVSGNGATVATVGQLTGIYTNAAISSGNPDAFVMDWLVQVASIGTLQVFFAQNSSTGNPTQLNAGSALLATRLG